MCTQRPGEAVAALGTAPLLIIIPIIGPILGLIGVSALASLALPSERINKADIPLWMRNLINFIDVQAKAQVLLPKGKAALVDHLRKQDFSSITDEIQIQISKKLLLRADEATAKQFGDLGVIYQQKGDISSACAHWRKARDLWLALGNKAQVAIYEGLLRDPR